MKIIKTITASALAFGVVFTSTAFSAVSTNQANAEELSNPFDSAVTAEEAENTYSTQAVNWVGAAPDVSIVSPTSTVNPETGLLQDTLTFRINLNGNTGYLNEEVRVVPQVRARNNGSYSYYFYNTYQSNTYTDASTDFDFEFTSDFLLYGDKNFFSCIVWAAGADGTFASSILAAISTDDEVYDCESQAQIQVLYQLIPVYRYWNPTSQTHFFTQNLTEKAIVDADPNWESQGVAFYSRTCNDPYATVARRYYNAGRGLHYYTINPTEQAALNADPVWTFEGNGFCAFTAAGRPAFADQVYKFFSPDNNSHFLTLNAAERDALIAGPDNVWTYQGVLFYALAL